MVQYSQQELLESPRRLNVIRWGGAVAILAGAFWAVIPLRNLLYDTHTPGTLTYTVDYIPNIAVWLGLLIGLGAVYSYSQRSLGLIGKIGVLVSGLGMLAMSGGLFYDFVLYLTQQRVTSGDVGFLVTIAVVYPGAILLGVGLWRSGVVPRTGPGLLVSALPVGLATALALENLGVTAPFTGLPITVLYGVGWMVLGYHLWTQRVETPASVSEQAPQ